MKKSLAIYLAILVVIAACIDFSLLRTETFAPSTTQTFSMGKSKNIFVSGGSDPVDVTTAGGGYYRIRFTGGIAEGKHISGDYFTSQDKLSTGQWQIEDGETISFTVVSETPVTVTLISTFGFVLGTVFITLVFTAALFLFVWVMDS